MTGISFYSERAKVQLGGEKEIVTNVVLGDVIIIPAGVTRKNLESSYNIVCIGGYPDGRNYDMNYGKPEEKEKAF